MRAKFRYYNALLLVLYQHDRTYYRCGESIADGLWHHMRRMGLYENEENHPVLGNIKQALEALVQQRLDQFDQVDFIFIMSSFT